MAGSVQGLLTAQAGKALQDGQDVLTLCQLALSGQNGIIANPGGAYIGSPVLTAACSEIKTAASANDSVALPQAIAGLDFSVRNSGAQTAKIYANTGNLANAGVADTIIDASGVAQTNVTLATNTTAVFRATALGRWVLN